MLALFAAALCGQFIANGHCVTPYHDAHPTGRAFWNAKAAEVLPGVLAAIIWK